MKRDIRLVGPALMALLLAVPACALKAAPAYQGGGSVIDGRICLACGGPDVAPAKPIPAAQP